MLRTVGAKWSYLQSHKFGSNAQPFYVVLDADGHALTPSRGYNEDVPAFVEYLNQGITQWRQKQN
jgi:thiol:disulfide interchange protein DsbD